MRFTSFIAAGLFAVAASAQSSTDLTSVTSVVETASSTTGEASSTVASSDTAQSTAASAIEQCLAACDPKDTNCRAHCIAVPSPDNENVNQTTACVAACPQGNGTAADNQAYADCVQGCIGQYYFTSSGTPNLATTANGGSSAVPSVTQVPTTITTDGKTITTSVPSTVAPSQSDSGNNPSSTSSSHAGAAVYGPVGTGLGFLGLLAGFVAL
ncbi:hypothetical protein HD806DRAFT_529563 [Xylariaceae sp. AK1471]|nr:hypothetical protein HD806DRAFT_529563 [Xylariaceae sp. AK1471]